MAKARDVERIEYIDSLDEIQIKDLQGFLASYEKRVFSAARDIFGEDSPAMEFFVSVRNTGSPHPNTFSEKENEDGTFLIKAESGIRLGQNFAQYLKNVFEKKPEFIVDEGLYVLWEQLEFAGMTHENIGKYFERFDASEE